MAKTWRSLLPKVWTDGDGDPPAIFAKAYFQFKEYHYHAAIPGNWTFRNFLEWEEPRGKMRRIRDAEIFEWRSPGPESDPPPTVGEDLM